MLLTALGCSKPEMMLCGMTFLQPWPRTTAILVSPSGVRDLQFEDFQHHRAQTPITLDSLAMLQGMPGMAFMMDAYEQELKRPIRNVVNGQLPRTLLIQVSMSFSRFHACCLPAAPARCCASCRALLRFESSDVMFGSQMTYACMQVQKLKLDTESAMLEMDQVWHQRQIHHGRAND